MPLTQVQRATAASAANATTLTATFGSTPTQNNLLLCRVNSDATVTMTSSGWTLAASQINATGDYLWYKLAGASEPTTVTVAPTSSASVEMIVEEQSGNTTSTPLDKTASATGASTGTTAATTQADELAVAQEGVSGGTLTTSAPTCTWTNSFVADTSVIGLGTVRTALNPSSKALSATGTVSSVPTTSNGNASGGLVATFKAAAGGSTPISDSESGTGTDAQSTLSVTASGSETSTGTDAGTASVTASSSDAGTGTDTGTVLRPLSDSESSTGTDAGTVSATASGSETATGTDSGTASTSGSGSESGSGVDTGAISVALAGADTGSGTDDGTVTDLSGGTIPVSGSDSGTGTDSGTVLDLTPPPVLPSGGGVFEEDSDERTDDVHFKAGHDSGVAADFGAVLDLTPPPARPRFAFRRSERPALVSGGDAATATETGSVMALATGADDGLAVDGDDFQMVGPDPVEAEMARRLGLDPEIVAFLSGD